MIVIFLMLVTLTTSKAHVLDINRIIDLLPQRRNIDNVDTPNNLPEAEPLLPGHTLLRLSNSMLKSAAKFPGDMTNAVYGNLENIGIRYDDTKDRVLYTSFRKGNDMWENVLEAFKKWNQSNGNKKKKLIILLRPMVQQPTNKIQKTKKIENLLSYGTNVAEDENNANEIQDESQSHKDGDGLIGGRKSSKKYRDRSDYYNQTDSDSSSSTGSSDYDKNPGNPFTIFKDKYRQNWLWNHYMDGDHVNINPYGPNLHDLGPSGAQMFFNRKWWYFNQDDYKPMG